VFLVALAAVYRPGPIRLEGNLGLLSAVRTYHVVHLSRGPVETAPRLIVIHYTSLSFYRFKESIALQTILTTLLSDDV
jgi:hypothetical protein